MNDPLVIGANGATGQKVLAAFIAKKQKVYALVRNADRLPQELRTNHYVKVIEGDVLSLSDDQLVSLLTPCDKIISCLGHNLSFKGIYFDPHRLVTRSIKRLLDIIDRRLMPQHFKLIILSSVGVKNTLSNEKSSLLESLMFSAIKVFIPPHADNLATEKLMSQLRHHGTLHKPVEWVMVRPDTLVNQLEPSPYEVIAMPSESPLFGNKQTSRANVGAFIAQLALDKATWDKWVFKLPVIYNRP